MRRLMVLAALTSAQTTVASDCVVVLHGLGRSSWSMSRISTTLAQHGYGVVNETYPSRKASVRQLSQVVGDAVDKCRASGAERISFVTHSLGGILVRAYFQDHVVAEAHRVVMLAPPNHGSEIVDAYAKNGWYRYFTGPAGQELGTDGDGIVKQLMAIPLEIGVIAGTKSMDPWFAHVMPAPHDGKVSVASARLPEMRDFITVPYSHTFMASRSAVTAQIIQFLATGTFKHAADGLKTRLGSSDTTPPLHAGD